MSIVIIAIIAVICSAAGCYAGYSITSKIVRNKKAAILKEAESAGEMIKKEKILQAKEKFIQLKSEHDRAVNERNQKLSQSEQRAKQLENNLTQQQDELNKKIREQDSVRERLQAQIESVERKKEDLDRKIKEQNTRLEQISGLSSDEAKTILIEKFGHDMASGIRDTLAACGSKQQQEDGDDVNKKDAVRYLCNWSQGYTRRSLAQVWADRSGETIDWFTDVLAESGVSFRHEIDEKRDNDNYKALDVGHSTQYGDEYSEQLTMDAVLKHAEADGLEVQYEITMVKLEKDGNRVTGLIAKNANDEYVRYNASKGVILATGDYMNNEAATAAMKP